MARDPRPTTEVSVALRDETRLRELDRRSAVVSSSVGALGARARHAWTCSAVIPVGRALQVVTEWAAEDGNGSSASHDGAGLFRLRQSGVWALDLSVSSDAAAPGNFTIALRVGGSMKLSGGFTGSGFAEAGRDSRQVVTVAPLGADDISVYISALTRWLTASTTPRTAVCRLQVDLLAGEPAA